METDVRWTSDNHAVIIHDEAATQGLRCDRPYRVSQTTWKDLTEHCRSFTKNGKSYPPTTYANPMEGLAAYSSWVYVEVKVDQNAAQNEEFIDVIRSNGLSDRTVVTSTTWPAGADREAGTGSSSHALRWRKGSRKPTG